MNCHQGRR